MVIVVMVEDEEGSVWCLFRAKGGDNYMKVFSVCGEEVTLRNEVL